MKSIRFDDIMEGDMILEYNQRTSFSHRKSILAMIARKRNNHRNIVGTILWFGVFDVHGDIELRFDKGDCWISNNPNLEHYIMTTDELSVLLMDLI